jgi:hypothetical protein
MNPPNDSPLDPASAAELIARVIFEIDADDDERRDDLLQDLACAAWGSALAQSQ